MPLPFATDPKLTLVVPEMAPLFTSSAPLSSSELPVTLSAPPELMVMRELPPLVRVLPVFRRVAPLLSVITPSLEKAVVVSVMEPSVILPLEELIPPFQVRAVLAVKFPPLMKLLRNVVPVAVMVDPAKAVSPLRFAEFCVLNVPGPARNPPLRVEPAIVTVAPAAAPRRPPFIVRFRDVVVVALKRRVPLMLMGPGPRLESEEMLSVPASMKVPFHWPAPLSTSVPGPVLWRAARPVMVP